MLAAAAVARAGSPALRPIEVRASAAAIECADGAIAGDNGAIAGDADNRSGSGGDADARGADIGDATDRGGADDRGYDAIRASESEGRRVGAVTLPVARPGDALSPGFFMPSAAFNFSRA